MKNLWHRIDACEEYPEGKDWHQVALHATDAAHALNVDPDHWAVDKPADPEPQPEPEPLTQTDGATE